MFGSFAPFEKCTCRSGCKHDLELVKQMRVDSVTRAGGLRIHICLGQAQYFKRKAMNIVSLRMSIQGPDNKARGCPRTALVSL